MKRALIISPLSGNVLENQAYLDQCLAYAISHGYAPFAGHAYLPAVLDDNDPAQRRLGMKIAREWAQFAEVALCFCDLGVSKGMRSDVLAAIAAGISVESIRIRR